MAITEKTMNFKSAPASTPNTNTGFFNSTPTISPSFNWNTIQNTLPNLVANAQAAAIKAQQDNSKKMAEMIQTTNNNLAMTMATNAISKLKTTQLDISQQAINGLSKSVGISANALNTEMKNAVIATPKVAQMNTMKAEIPEKIGTGKNVELINNTNTLNTLKAIAPIDFASGIGKNIELINNASALIAKNIGQIENIALSKLLIDATKQQMIKGEDALRVSIDNLAFNTQDILKNAALTQELINSGKVTATDLQTKALIPVKSVIGAYLSLSKTPTLTPTVVTDTLQMARITYGHEVSLATYVKDNPTRTAAEIGKLFYGNGLTTMGIKSIQSAMDDLKNINTQRGDTDAGQLSPGVWSSLETAYLKLDRETPTVVIEGNRKTQGDLDMEAAARKTALTPEMEYAIKMGKSTPILTPEGIKQHDQYVKAVEQSVFATYTKPALAAMKDATPVDEVLAKYTDASKYDLTKTSPIGAILSLANDVTTSNNEKLRKDGLMDYTYVQGDAVIGIAPAIFTLFDHYVNGVPWGEQKQWKITDNGQMIANAVVLKTAQDGLGSIQDTKNTGKYALLSFSIEHADALPIAQLTQNKQAIADIGSIIGVGGALENRVGAKTIKQAQDDTLVAVDGMTLDQTKAQVYRTTSAENTWALLSEVKDAIGSSAVSDNQLFNAIAFPFVVVGAGELFDAAKGGKVLLTQVPKAAEIFRTATTSEKLGDLFRFANDATIKGPESLFSGTGIGEALSKSLGSTKLGSVSMVTLGDIGSIAKAIEPSVDVKKVTEISRAFDIAVEGNPLQMTKFTEALNTVNKVDASAALTEITAKYGLETVKNTIEYSKLGSLDVTQADKTAALFESAKDGLTKVSKEKLVPIAIKYASGDTIGATNDLYNLRDFFGNNPLKNMIKTLDRTEYENTLTNVMSDVAKWDEQIAVEIPTIKPTGATAAVTSKAIDLNALIPSMQDRGINDWGKYTNKLKEIKVENIPEIKTIKDLDGLTNSQISTLAQKLSIEMYPDTKRIEEITNWAKNTAKGDIQKENKLISEELVKLDKNEPITTWGRSDAWVNQVRMTYDPADITLSEAITRKLAPTKLEIEKTLLEAKTQAANTLGTEYKKAVEMADEPIGDMVNEDKVTSYVLDTKDAENANAYEKIPGKLKQTEATTISDTKVIEAYKKGRELEQKTLMDMKATRDTLIRNKADQTRIDDISSQISKQEKKVAAIDSEIQDAVFLNIGQKKITLPVTKKVLVQPNTAARNAITELKNGNIKAAAERLAESNKANAPITLTLDSYKDLNVQQILKMKEFGAPTAIVDNMAWKRSQQALQELDKMETSIKKVGFKINNDIPLTEADRTLLWNGPRSQAIEAVYVPEKENSLISGVVKDAIESGDPTRRAKILDDMQKDLDYCTNVLKVCV